MARLPALLASLAPLVALAPPAPCALRSKSTAAEVRSVAGGAGDFLRATHVRLAGTQREIGRALAALAAERHGFRPPDAPDPAAQRPSARTSRSGRSFVWENAVDLSGGHAIAGDGGPQISTNYLQHLHPDVASLPDDPDGLGLFGRQCTLLARIEGQGKLSLDEIRANAAHVAAARPARPGFPPGRTLWHALYFPAERRMEVDFYLGETSGEDGQPRIRRSPRFSFALTKP